MSLRSIERDRRLKSEENEIVLLNLKIRFGVVNPDPTTKYYWAEGRDDIYLTINDSYKMVVHVPGYMLRTMVMTGIHICATNPLFTTDVYSYEFMPGDIAAPFVNNETLSQFQARNIATGARVVPPAGTAMYLQMVYICSEICPEVRILSRKQSGAPLNP